MDVHSPVSRFGPDTTLRWSCRAGDYVLWMRVEAGASASTPPTILDFWQMQDGDSLTITNRGADIPAWLDLDQYEDGPNFWRVCPGDRVAWVGEPRPCQAALGGIFFILDCQACAVVIAETTREMTAVEIMTMFGPVRDPTPREMAYTRNAVAVVKAMACPKPWDGEWQLG
jgi:hypothetical protein